MKTNAIKYTVAIFILFTVFATSCSEGMPEVKSKRNDAIKEIKKAEEDFAALCAKSGVQKAFSEYSDDSARIHSSDTLISGKKAIEKYYGQTFFKSVSLQWSPDYIDASESGDMGYTYGHYIFKITGKGKKEETKGIFHTVWKKKNGKWKFVWDS